MGEIKELAIRGHMEVSAAVVALAEHGVTPDVQDLLVRGDPSRGIPPGALERALKAAALSPAPQPEQVVQAEGDQILESKYARLEALMDAKAGTPEAVELSRLAAELEAHEGLETDIAEADARAKRQAERYRELSATLGFHWKDGWFFRRLNDGSIRVARYRSFDHEPAEVMTIDAGSWRSICAATNFPPQPEQGLAAGWKPVEERPESGRKIVAIYNDGCAGVLFFVHDEGLIDAEGDAHDFDALPDRFSRWAYLPSGLKLWCEIRGGEDQFDFPSNPTTTGQGEDGR